MLAIRIFHDSGYEQIYELAEGSEITYIPEENGEASHLHIGNQDTSIPGLIITNATVYIMNSSGKTIADYHLFPLKTKKE